MHKNITFAKLAFNWVIELNSIVIFWVAFKIAGLMSAILWSMLATLITIGLAMVIQKRLPPFPMVMAVMVVVFCGYSLVTQDPWAFVVQHTLYYGMGCLILLFGLFNGKSLLKPLFDNLFALTDRGWLILARRWAVLFLLLACGNEVVWRTMSHADWAHYKAGMTLTITLFGLWQLRLARRERLPNASRWGFKIQ